MFILVGPEDTRRVEFARLGRAPRLDYRLVAERCQGVVRPCYPSPAMLRGAKSVRLLRSASANMLAAAQVLRSAPTGSVIYSTGETWGLPVAIVGNMMNYRRHTHIVYVHRVYSPLWLWLIRNSRSFLRADGWICTTRYQARLLRQALGPERAPIAVVSQGVDTAFFDPAKATSSHRSPYILAIGAEMRDYPLLFEAVRNLNIDVIVKASSAWMATGRRKVASIPANVTWLNGRLSYLELRDLYAGASLVVLPLQDTPQAAGITTILEAMAMRKCVMVTRSRGVPDSLVDGVTGLVVEPSADQMAESILAILRSPDQATELAANGHRLVRERVNLEAHVTAVADFLTHTARPDKTLARSPDDDARG